VFNTQVLFEMKKESNRILSFQFRCAIKAKRCW